MHVIFAVIPILTLQLEECRFSAPREATVDARDAALLVIHAGAGAMRVESKAGLQQARVRGEACASDRALLEEIELKGRRAGDEIRIYANDRDLDLRGREYARLNVVIEVPEDLAARIYDDSGDMELIGLGALDIVDGSGDILIDDVDGNVVVDDQSGGIRIGHVRGDVLVKDGSGEIDVYDVEGTVDVRDGSGAVKLARVSRDALISDGSGDIEIDGVGGDLTIRSDSHGRAEVSGVRGAVNVPRKRDYHRSWLWPFR